MERESQTEALWRRLLREGELVFIGYGGPKQSFFEEGAEQAIVDMFLSKVFTGDRQSKKLRVSVKIIKE